MKNTTLSKKNFFRMFPSVQKVFSSRFLRFKLGASGRQVPLRFLVRGVFERRFLWKSSYNSWFDEWRTSEEQQPSQRTIWTPPRLPRYRLIWLTYHRSLSSKALLWEVIGVSYKALHGDWRYWLFNRLVILSAILSCIFGVTSSVLLFYFIFFELPVALMFFLFSAHLTFWLICKLGLIVWVWMALGFMFLFLWGTSLSVSFHSISPIWRPKWTFFRSLARPQLRHVIRAYNRRHYQYLRFGSFFNWFGVLAKHSFFVRSFAHSLRGRLASFNHNFFFWEKTPNYHSQGQWHYNVTHDFWFDMHYNYPTYIGYFGQVFRDILLEVHPFLLLRRIMTDEAVGLVKFSWNSARHDRYYLTHYAKKRWLYAIAIFCALLGRTVFYATVFLIYFSAAKLNFSKFQSLWRFYFERYIYLRCYLAVVGDFNRIPVILHAPVSHLSYVFVCLLRRSDHRFHTRYDFGPSCLFSSRQLRRRFDFWALSQIKRNFPYTGAGAVPFKNQFYSNFFFRNILRSSFRNFNTVRDPLFLIHGLLLRHYFVFFPFWRLRVKLPIKLSLPRCSYFRFYFTTNDFFFISSFCLILSLSYSSSGVASSLLAQKPNYNRGCPINNS